MFTRKTLPALVSSSLLGMGATSAHAADIWVGDEPSNNTANAVSGPFSPGDTYNGFIQSSDEDYFSVTGLNPGSQVQVCIQNWPSPHNFGFDLDIFNSATLSVLDNVDVPNSPGTTEYCSTVTVPSNGALGFRVNDLKSGSGEGYRVSLRVQSTVSVPLAPWPMIPLLGAAAIAELRRRQKRKGASHQA